MPASQMGEFCPGQHWESNPSCQNDQHNRQENPCPRFPNWGFESSNAIGIHMQMDIIA